MSISNIIAFPVRSTGARVTNTAGTADDFAGRADVFAGRADVFRLKSADTVPAAKTTLDSGALWRAISEGRIEMHYQPQYELHSKRTIAAEALVRLVDEDASLIYPDRFIELAEESGLIVPLGRMVIEQVCADLARLRADGTALKRIAINVSAHQLNIDAKLLEFIDQTLHANGLAHADLEFELVERQSLSPEHQGLETLHALAERGSRIVIDDFGTGYSSISYLTDLPVSGFKLDRSLIGQLGDQKSITVVSGLLAMADHLGLDVVAEGIETEAQHETLLASSCRQGQGFGHSRPMPLPALIGFLATAPLGRREHVGALV